jgi:hypothetical protein
MLLERVDTSFHETFALNRPAIAQVMKICHETGGAIRSENIREGTTLGTNYVKAMPRYARACGFLEMGGYALTRLGEAIYARDPSLSEVWTIWLMHYHLSAPHGPGPAFWHNAVATRLRLGEEIEPSQLAFEITAFVRAATGKELAHRTASAAATVFLGSYLKSDALGKLRVLRLLGDKTSRRYCVIPPDPAPPSVIAYALADFWEARFGAALTVSESEICETSCFGDLFFVSRDDLRRLLEEFQRGGLLEIHRVAPPYQVARLWATKQDLVEGLFK